MARTIRVGEPAGKVIRDTSAPPARVAPAAVAAALGADAPAETVAAALAPITLFALRSELLGRLQSSGGRPALEGTSRRAKVPLGDAEWADLEKLAAVVAEPGFSPSVGQIASVLLRLSARSVVTEVERAPEATASPVARDLAAQATDAASSRPPRTR